jgi:hypothetical protein
MPARRRPARQASEDIEEGGASSQTRPTRDDVEDDGGQSQPTTGKATKKTAGKKAAVNGKQRAAAAATGPDDEAADAADDDEENEDDFIDVSALTDQPLKRDNPEAGKLKNMKDDWQKMLDKMEQNASKAACDVATALAEVSEGDKVSLPSPILLFLFRI